TLMLIELFLFLSFFIFTEPSAAGTTEELENTIFFEHAVTEKTKKITIKMETIGLKLSLTDFINNIFNNKGEECFNNTLKYTIIKWHYK
ncbi:MAG: hypothetical protein ABI861_05950, partial [Panacibacter sp.]